MRPATKTPPGAPCSKKQEPRDRRPGKSTTDHRQLSTEARLGDRSPLSLLYSPDLRPPPLHSVTGRAVAWFFDCWPVVRRDLTLLLLKLYSSCSTVSVLTGKGGPLPGPREPVSKLSLSLRRESMAAIRYRLSAKPHGRAVACPSVKCSEEPILIPFGWGGVDGEYLFTILPDS
jgi:hypothetical protein